MATAAKNKTAATKAAATKAAPKRKDTLTALADATLAKRGNKPELKAAPKRSAAAKRADPVPAKRAIKVGSNISGDTMMPEHVVKNLKGLRAAMDKYPNATGYSVDFKFGISIVNLLNTRGRTLAQVKLISKK